MPKKRPHRVWKVTIEYVPLPEHMRDWAYNETVRIFLKAKVEKLNAKKLKERVLNQNEGRNPNE